MSSGGYDAFVVGGGHNGLVCASYLAKGGLRVLVLERREILGGACVTEELFPGFRFSAWFHVYHIDPQKCSLFPGDRALVVWDDVERTQDAIAKFSTHDAAAYPHWVRFWERAAGLIYPYFLRPAPTLAELAAGLRTADDQAFLDALVGAS
ncbi:MAG: NAD(P)/FAD-dependent oxidoreductase, partial [Bacillati bacterium ANGP1]